MIVVLFTFICMLYFRVVVLCVGVVMACVVCLCVVWVWMCVVVVLLRLVLMCFVVRRCSQPPKGWVLVFSWHA